MSKHLFGTIGAAVAFALSLVVPAFAGGDSDYQQEYEAQSDLGSASEYMNATEESESRRVEHQHRRVIVEKSDKTILDVGMGDDLSVSSVPGRPAAPGPARFFRAPLEQRYLIRHRAATSAPMDVEPSSAAEQAPRYYSRRPHRRVIVETGMGDDLAITPVPGQAPR